MREGAILFVLYVTDTMDCSLENHGLFAPDTKSDDSPFGHYGSFRCFEYGFRCDINDRMVEGPRTGCEPVEGWLHPISRYVEFYQDLKPPGQVVLAAIAGTPDPIDVYIDQSWEPSVRFNDSCFEGGAAPALRIDRLLRQFPPRRFLSKCDELNYGPFMERLGREIAQRLTHYCLPPPSPEREGLTPAAAEKRCSVVDTRAMALLSVCGEHSIEQCWSPAAAEWCPGGAAFTLREPLDETSELYITCTY